MFNMSSRMERKKEERRETILNGAEYLIAKHGYKSMTMDQVALIADVAKGTLYLYFKNKSTLCAAVNARINKQLNQHMKEKMDLYDTGSEKLVAAGTAVIEFSHQNPQKWKAGAELYQIKFKDPEDPNVQDSLHEANITVHMLADAYRRGIKEGTIRNDVDPIPTAIYNRMVINNAFTPTSEQKLLLELNNISQEHYLSVSWNLINRSTHIKPSIREESEKPVEKQRSQEDIAKEIKGMAESMELPAENAPDIVDAWEILSKIIMGNPEYETIESSNDRVVNHITHCPANYNKEKDITATKNTIEGCQRYCKILVETLNPKYTQKFNKRICSGDDYCESVVELKK